MKRASGEQRLSLVAVDTGVKQELTRLARTAAAAAGGQCQLGVLLVRKVATGSRVFVLTAVPFQPDDDDDCDVHLGWRTVSDVPRRAVEALVQGVTRMLVGGISVGGVYTVSSEVGKVAVEGLGRLWPTPGGVLVHVSSESSAFTVRAVADAGAGAGAGARAGGAKGSSGAGGGRGGGAGELAVVDVKYQSVAGKLITYHCMFDVALDFEAPTTSSTTAANSTARAEESEGDGRTSLAALQAEEDAFFRAFLKATKAEEALLAQAVCFPAVGADSGEEEGEGRFTKIGPNLARVVEMYTPAFVKPSGQKPFSSAGGAVRPVQVYGSVGCVACIHEKESDQDGVAALKEDCLRSLRDRVHILREEAATELEESKGGCLDPSTLAHAIHAPEGGVVRLPRRVLLPLDPASASSMLLAEYLLPGEEAGEAVARVKGVFGLLPPSGVVVGGRDREAAVVFPELEAAVVAVGLGGHQNDAAMGMGMGMGRALQPSLGRISSCNSLSMGRAPSTSSLLGMGRFGRVDSSAPMASSMPRVGSMVALEGEEEERPVTMDAEEEEEEEGEEVPIIDALGEGPSPLALKADANKEVGVLSSVASSPQLMICTLVVGLAMVVGAALLHDLKAAGPG